MKTPSSTEYHASQIPVLLLLCRMGYTYLKPEEVEKLRGSQLDVLLRPVLEDQLRKINKIEFQGNEYPFSNHNISAAAQKVSDIPLMNGLIEAIEELYYQLIRGINFEETIEGTCKSFILQYIDWKHPEYNVFHVAHEFGVQHNGSYQKPLADIVLFVNGIPLAIIESKRPDLSMGKKITMRWCWQSRDSVAYSTSTLPGRQ